MTLDQTNSEKPKTGPIETFSKQKIDEEFIPSKIFSRLEEIKDNATLNSQNRHLADRLHRYSDPCNYTYDLRGNCDPKNLPKYLTSLQKGKNVEKIIPDSPKFDLYLTEKQRENYKNWARSESTGTSPPKLEIPRFYKLILFGTFTALKDQNAEYYSDYTNRKHIKKLQKTGETVMVFWFKYDHKCYKILQKLHEEQMDKKLPENLLSEMKFELKNFIFDLAQTNKYKYDPCGECMTCKKGGLFPLSKYLKKNSAPKCSARKSMRLRNKNSLFESETGIEVSKKSALMLEKSQPPESPAHRHFGISADRYYKNYNQVNPVWDEKDCFGNNQKEGNKHWGFMAKKDIKLANSLHFVSTKESKFHIKNFKDCKFCNQTILTKSEFIQNNHINGTCQLLKNCVLSDEIRSNHYHERLGSVFNPNFSPKLNQEIHENINDYDKNSSSRKRIAKVKEMVAKQDNLYLPKALDDFSYVFDRKSNIVKNKKTDTNDSDDEYDLRRKKRKIIKRLDRNLEDEEYQQENLAEDMERFYDWVMDRQGGYDLHGNNIGWMDLDEFATSQTYIDQLDEFFYLEDEMNEMDYYSQEDSFGMPYDGMTTSQVIRSYMMGTGPFANQIGAYDDDESSSESDSWPEQNEDRNDSSNIEETPNTTTTLGGMFDQ